jgi:hypothetical protein
MVRRVVGVAGRRCRHNTRSSSSPRRVHAARHADPRRWCHNDINTNCGLKQHFYVRGTGFNGLARVFVSVVISDVEVRPKKATAMAFIIRARVF